MDSKKEQLQILLKRKKSKEYYSKILKISVSEVEDLLNEIHGKSEQTTGNFKHNATTDAIDITGIWTEIPTPEKILDRYSIDVNKYKLSNTRIKDHIKGFLVSVSFLPKTEKGQNIDKFTKFLDNYKSKYVPSSVILQNKLFKPPTSAVISLTDFHLDKRNITKDTIEQKVNSYREVLDILLQQAYNTKFLEEIVFVVGNDFFQTDTIAGTTTAGTPVDYDISWDEAYEIGFDLMVESIIKAKQFCETLHVILVQGNHATSKEYYLAHALQVFFKNDTNIVFNRSSSEMKVHTYGETLFCFHHGNCANDKLPLAFATSFHKEWGQSKYHEILLGDKHHSTQKMMKNIDETMGVRMRILPALTGTDNWHSKNLFINSRQAGLVLLYDKEKGKVGEFEEII